jgi:hypothetical protein
MPRKLVVCLPLLGLAACYLALSAVAQDNAHGKWISDPAGLATPAFVYDPPPGGFNPLSASDVELQQYGFPPRPSRSDPNYLIWKRLVTATRVPPQVTPTKIYNGPAKNVLLRPTDSNAPGTTYGAVSTNWSGYALDGPNGTFTPNGTYVLAYWQLPVATQSVNPPVCNSTWGYSFQWVGFDGWGTSQSDVLQAGTEADANCTSTLYSFWYEWYPLAETRVSLAVYPGDEVLGWVTYYTSSPHGNAALFNETKNTVTVVGFNPPSGTNLVGNSAEWILERPTENGALSDLAEVQGVVLWNTYARVGSQNYYPGSTPANVNVYDIDMQCPPWNPSSSCSSTSTIAYPLLYGIGAMPFTVATPPQ